MAEDSGECVYVIGAPGSHTVKIGRSVHPQKRLAEIQRMSPVHLVILWSHPGGHELETNLHRQFSCLRSHGEWFTFQADPIAMIAWATATQPWRLPKVPLRRLKAPKALPAPVRTPRQRVSPAPSAEAVAALERVMAELRAIVDPQERYQRSCEIEAELNQAFREAQRGVVLALKSQGRTWQQVGAELGFSGQRAHQLSVGDRPQLSA